MSIDKEQGEGAEVLLMGNEAIARGALEAHLEDLRGELGRVGGIGLLHGLDGLVQLPVAVEGQPDVGAVVVPLGDEGVVARAQGILSRMETV